MSCPTLNQLFQLTTVNTKPFFDVVIADIRSCNVVVRFEKRIQLMVIVGHHLAVADHDVRDITAEPYNSTNYSTSSTM